MHDKNGTAGRIIDAFRSQFPITERYCYLDHAGIAPLSLRVAGAVKKYLSESAEGAAFHYPDWLQRTDGIRRSCAKLLNADAGEIAFVKSTSHGLSLVAQGLAWSPGDNVLCYERDFPSNIFPWLDLRRKGVEVRVVPSRDGGMLIDDIERLMDRRTRLLSVSSVQFSNGYRIDLKRAGELCRSRGVLFCVDAIQSLGMVPMDVRKHHIGFLSADGHKWLLGPEGIGIFYCRRELVEQLHPVLLGWKSVQKELDFDHPELTLKDTALRFEEGSMNLMGIFGLGAAIDLLFEAGISRIEQRVLDLGDLIIQRAEERGFRILTPKERTARAGIVTFTGGFDPAAMRDALRKQGVMVNVRGGGLRVSPHFYTTDDDIKALFTGIDRMAAEVRS